MEQRLKKIKSDEEKSKLKPADREDELRRATSAGGGDVTASPADTEHWAQCGVLGLLTRQPVTGPVWVSVHGGHTSVREFLSEWVATENPHQTAHSALERGNTPLFVLLWESMLGRKQGKTRQTSGNLRNWSREAQMDTEVSHRIRTLLVTQLFPVKALRQDLVLWHTHDLQTHTQGTFSLNINSGKENGSLKLCLTSFRFLKSRSLFLSKNPERRKSQMWKCNTSH